MSPAVKTEVPFLLPQVTHYKRLLNYIKPDYVHVMEVGSFPSACTTFCLCSSTLPTRQPQRRQRAACNRQLTVPEAAHTQSLVVSILSVAAVWQQKQRAFCGTAVGAHHLQRRHCRGRCARIGWL